MTRWIPSAALLTLCGALTLCVSSARAEEGRSEKDQAERLFLRGKELMEAQKTEAACVSFEESLRHDRAGGTLLNLAECYVALERYASAEGALEEARALAETAGRADALKFVDGRLADVRPKVNHLRIQGPTTVPGLAVTLDGNAMAASTEGVVEVAVDPGRHDVSASAPGFVSFTTALDIEGAGSRLSLTIPPLAAASPPSRGDAPAPTTQRTIGWSVGSVGVASLAIGAVLGAAALAAWDDAETRCPEPSCTDDEGVAAAQRAGVLADGATIALGIGGACAALGLTLVLTAPSSSAPRVALVPTYQGLALRGTFQ